MLANVPLPTILPVVDLPRARAFHEQKLAISFGVRDITAAIQELQGRGVGFHEDALPGLKTVNHFCVLGSEKAAWFSDSEGNILCLHEDLA
jgi:hypothetical protein